MCSFEQIFRQFKATNRRFTGGNTILKLNWQAGVSRCGATKGRSPTGRLCDHRRFAYAFPLRGTRHWRDGALWKPSQHALICYFYLRLVLGCVSKSKTMHFRHLIRHFCVDEPRFTSSKPSVHRLELTENLLETAHFSF